MADSAKWVTATHVADALGVSATAIRTLAASGAIPHIKVGARYRFQIDEVVAALRQTPLRSPAPTRRRAHHDDDEGMQNIRDANVFLREIDPDNRMTRAESLDALRRRFPHFEL